MREVFHSYALDMLLSIPLGVDLAPCHIVNELRRNLILLIDEQRKSVSRCVLETLQKNNSYRVDVQVLRWASWGRTTKRLGSIPCDLGNDLVHDTEATEMHLLRCLTSVDVGFGIERAAASGSLLE